MRVAPVSALWRLHTISYRNHRKIAVIDGRVGYTGGMNIGQEHLDGGPSFDRWRDTHVAHRGRGRRRAAGRVPGRLVQRDGRGSFRGGPVPLAWGGARRRRPDVAEARDAVVPVQILTSGPGLASGGQSGSSTSR